MEWRRGTEADDDSDSSDNLFPADIDVRLSDSSRDDCDKASTDFDKASTDFDVVDDAEDGEDDERVASKAKDIPRAELTRSSSSAGTPAAFVSNC